MPKIRIARLTSSITNINSKISKPLSGKIIKTSKTSKLIIEKKPTPIRKLPLMKYQIRQPFDK